MGKHKHKKAAEEEEEEEEEEEKGEGEACAEGEEAMDTSVTQKRAVESKTYEELVALVSVISKPLASKKLTKKLYKAVRKAQKAKRLKRGVREVVKAIRKDERGVVVLAGDVSPIDVISHIPVFCEDKDLPYCYTPSRKDLGLAGGTMRPTSVVMIQDNEQYGDLYKELHSSVAALPLPI